MERGQREEEGEKREKSDMAGDRTSFKIDNSEVDSHLGCYFVFFFT